MAAKQHDGATSEQLRALRDIKLADRVDPAAVARAHEAAFLGGFNSAQRELDWLIEHSAWTLLGYESAAGWWDARVKPVMVQLEMRPTPEMCDKILAKVREEERALPRSQRRTQRELESLTLASEWLVRGRTETRNRRSAAGADLEERPAQAKTEPDTTPTPLRGISQDRAMNLAKVVGEAYGLPTDTAAEDASRPTDGGEDLIVLPPAAGPGPTNPSGEADRPGPAVNPENLTENDAAPAQGDVEAPPSPVQGGIGDGGQAGQAESDDSPPAEPAEPEELTSPLSGEADPVPDETGVTRPAPDPSDPAELLVWFAEMWERVDADVAGPLLTSDDLEMLSNALTHITNIVVALRKWADRAQP